MRNTPLETQTQTQEDPLQKYRRRRLIDSLPTRVNHVATGMSTPVRDQGGCGSCWAFAATSVVESAVLLSGYAVAAGNLSLSNQELVDCANSASTNNQYYGNGCNGGWSDHAINFVSGYGQVLSAIYPYVARAQACPSALLTSSVPTSTNGQGVRLSGRAKTVARYSVAALMQAVARQPVTFYFMVDGTFFSYRGGVYYPSSCTANYNHASKSCVCSTEP